jgi:conjugative relaxase-like TrwC/TraI family protein
VSSRAVVGPGFGGVGCGFAGAGSEVTEAQMLALFGVGMHPDAAALVDSLGRSGLPPAAVDAAVRLGRAYPIHDGATEWRCRLAQRFAHFNAAEGLPRDWPVPPDVRARIRSELGRQMFAAEFGRLPADPRELAGYIARASRQATAAVAGYDLTFTPVKSVSVLWALADPPVARLIEAAHDAAVGDTLRWIEQHELFTRSGRAGVQQLEVTGMLAARFVHRDARSGDPNLHTHVAVSNKVQAPDGRWLAVDGRVLHKMAVAASERYNTRLEAQLRDRLGLRFAARPDTDPGRRQVREVVGVSARLAETWSARRTVIEARRAQLSLTFQAEHGRPPTKVEEIALAQQATLETRPGKHAPRSLAEQRAQWRTTAEGLLGAAGAQQMLTDILPRTRPSHPPLTGETLDRMVGDLARTVVTTVETERATWQVTHVRAEAERRARAADLPPAQTDQIVDAVVATVLADAIPLGAPDPVTAAPAVLRRSDGQSVYQVAGAQLYTTGRILAAERRILAAAARADGRTCHARSVERALLEAAANGTDLNPGQLHLVRQLATTPARVWLALAPAGTGKTTAMRALAQAWRDDGGTVLGLAPSAAAAAVLRAEINTTREVHCDTLAKLIDSLTRHRLAAWAATLDQRTLVIIDEAGMAATTDLACAVDWIIQRGGTVRLIGDDQQLASVASGGILRDLADTYGAVTLPQVIRFRDPAEGAASLALRCGDPAALGYYLDHHRIHVGDPITTVEQLFTAWTLDRAAGRDSVMLAPTRDLVTQPNLRARQHRLTTTARRRRGSCGRELRLADRSACSRGDPVITRHNNRRLPISRTDWVKNGDRWTVTAVCRDGSLTVRHAVTGRRVTLPAGYARQHVELGYAATIHSAQGITADTCHLLVTGTETRQLLYVGLSRGRDANHAYLTVAGDGDPHTATTRDAVLPRRGRAG